MRPPAADAPNERIQRHRRELTRIKRLRLSRTHGRETQAKANLRRSGGQVGRRAALRAQAWRASLCKTGRVTPLRACLLSQSALNPLYAEPTLANVERRSR